MVSLAAWVSAQKKDQILKLYVKQFYSIFLTASSFFCSFIFFFSFSLSLFLLLHPFFIISCSRNIMLFFCGFLFQVFAQVLRHFGLQLQELEYDGINVVLIVDNSEVHLSLDDIETAMEFNIHLVALIKNSTGDTQPLDKVYFGPFQRALETEKQHIIYGNGSGRLVSLQKRDIVKCGTIAFAKVDTPENRASAFRSTGLWPVDPHIFDKKFAALRYPYAAPTSSAVPASSAAPVDAPAPSTYDLAGD